jgi:hypothetical protein
MLGVVLQARNAAPEASAVVDATMADELPPNIDAWRTRRCKPDKRARRDAILNLMYHSIRTYSEKIPQNYFNAECANRLLFRPDSDDDHHEGNWHITLHSVKYNRLSKYD